MYPILGLTCVDSDPAAVWWAGVIVAIAATGLCIFIAVGVA